MSEAADRPQVRQRHLYCVKCHRSVRRPALVPTSQVPGGFRRSWRKVLKSVVPRET
jgi:hypothetical protein